MKKISLFLLFLFLTGCVGEEVTKMDVKMHNADGDTLGTITLTEQASGIKLDIDLSGLPSGEHAMHIHDKSSCEGPDFKSAGDHFNPDDKKHGLLHPEGAHAGDLPNIIVKEGGVVKAELKAPLVTLKEGKASLLTKDGKSIVIHDGKDDGMSQPAGDAGERIACGEITKQ
ncbi:superoxide dismutase family protein [Niallia sp. XMNu-256]|uniref:superoxide dismutase family protein n=1 Tax=Niallia sp. XMNu-256 TaxID=3082444 RepID=UPI0030CD8F41